MEVTPKTNDLEECATLVRRIISGDGSAEAELVNRYKRGLSAILLRSAGQRSVAEDLMQDTFQLALEKIRRGDVREPERLSGFICNIARNLVIDHFRQTSRHERLERELPPNIVSAADPLQQVLATERTTIVRRILEELRPVRDRQVLYRFYIAEQDKEQICAELGLTSLHFNRVLFRARERYRELYAKLVKERPAGLG
jgi:RNA polymerase sigma-70 factor (ECF subfamily)